MILIFDLDHFQSDLPHLWCYCVFQVAEKEEEEKERLANWDKFLNEEDEASDGDKRKSGRVQREQSMIIIQVATLSKI